MEYNTSRVPLIIPEYGRHIQTMIEQAVLIEDRQERNKVARAIIDIMGNLNPHLRDVPDFQHKLWDQLFIMSSFQLEVDSPFGKPTPETTKVKPNRLNYPQKRPKYRFYGNNMMRMIKVCTTWQDSPLKEALKYAIAHHMKKCFILYNREGVEDRVIFAHLKELSEGDIDLKSFSDDKGMPVSRQSNLRK